MTDEQLLAILKDEQSRSDLKSFPGNANQATCVKAMRRAYDAGFRIADQEGRDFIAACLA